MLNFKKNNSYLFLVNIEIILSPHSLRIFQAKMDTIKYRNCMDLTEAEGIKKRWQKYTEELYKKDLNDLYNHDAVVTDLEPDILECKVKWAL